MAGLQCVCVDVFTASCGIEPTGCAFAWILLLMMTPVIRPFDWGQAGTVMWAKKVTSVGEGGPTCSGSFEQFLEEIWADKWIY